MLLHSHMGVQVSPWSLRFWKNVSATAADSQWETLKRRKKEVVWVGS